MPSLVHTQTAFRAALTLYMAFANEMIARLEQHDQDVADGLEPGPIEWSAVRSALVATLPEIGWASLREWLVEGIRITYARHVHATYNRRSAWKFLKGAPVQLGHALSVPVPAPTFSGCSPAFQSCLSVTRRSGACSFAGAVGARVGSQCP